MAPLIVVSEVGEALDAKPELLMVAVIATAEVVGPAGRGDIDTYLTTGLADQDLENIKLDWADLERAGVVSGGPPGASPRERFICGLERLSRLWQAIRRIHRD